MGAGHRRHALHRHGRDADAGGHPLRRRAGDAVGGRSRSAPRWPRSAVRRVPRRLGLASGLAETRERDRDGGGRQRHALHGHDGGAFRAGPRRRAGRPGLIATDALGYSVGLSRPPSPSSRWSPSCSIGRSARRSPRRPRSARAKSASACSSKARASMRSFRSIPTAGWRNGMPEPSGSWAIPPPKSSASRWPLFLAADGVRADDAERQIQRGRATRDVSKGEHWWTRKDGALFLAHIVISALDDAAGNRVEFSVLVRDVDRTAPRGRGASPEPGAAPIGARGRPHGHVGAGPRERSPGPDRRRAPRAGGSSRSRSCSTRVHPDDRASVEEALKLGASEGRFDVDFRMLTSSGRESAGSTRRASGRTRTRRSGRAWSA